MGSDLRFARFNHLGACLNFPRLDWCILFEDVPIMKGRRGGAGSFGKLLSCQ